MCRDGGRNQSLLCCLAVFRGENKEPCTCVRNTLASSIKPCVRSSDGFWSPAHKGQPEFYAPGILVWFFRPSEAENLLAAVQTASPHLSWAPNSFPPPTSAVTGAAAGWCEQPPNERRTQTRIIADSWPCCTPPAGSSAPNPPSSQIKTSGGAAGANPAAPSRSIKGQVLLLRTRARQLFLM